MIGNIRRVNDENEIQKKVVTGCKYLRIGKIV